MTRISFVCRVAFAATLLVPAMSSANPPRDTGAANEQKPPATTLSEADLHLLTGLHATNQMEIEMGNLAKARGATKATKAYGKMLVTDHGKADKNVLALAKERGATLADHPTPKDDAEKQQMDKDMATMEKLKTLDGAAFDKEFFAAMVDGHGRTLAKIDAAMGTVADAKLKGLLVKIKPVVQKHHDKAQALSSTDTAAAK